jgi:hypothetical protein
VNKTRPNRVYFRVTNEELEQIDKCVKESGMTRQDWILSVVTPCLTGGDTENKEVVTPLTDTQPNVKLCPECGAAMQIKNGRRDKFWGCTNYPRCHHTEDWNGN